MDGEQPLARENSAHHHHHHHQQQQQQENCQQTHNSPIAVDSSIRENRYYDPINESREWQQAILNAPSQLSHIPHLRSSSWSLPSLVAYQSSSHRIYQELPSPFTPQEPEATIQTRMPFDGLRNDPNSHNATHHITGLNNGRTSDPESLLLHTRHILATGSNNSGTTSSNFVSPMFLSNPELAIIDTHRAQRNYATTEQNIYIPYHTQSRPELRNIVSTQQRMNIDFPSEVRSILSQGPSHLRRRNRSHLDENEESLLALSNNNVALQRRQYEAAFGTSITDEERSIAAMRGAIASGKRIPSREAMASLETVKLEDLENSDRSCIICYNEFGVKNPEGIVEIPLRLPKCKHIFGDKCIKKWFEDSDSCPYCRDKLPSEISLKKICGLESFRETGEGIYALRQRARQGSISARYISTVDIANARLAQPMQSSNISQSIGNPLIGGSESFVSRSTHWPNFPVNRIMVNDSSERRRHIRSRISSPRSIHHLGRQNNTASARIIHLNPPISSNLGTGLQISTPISRSLSSFNSGIQNYTSASGAARGQETSVHTSPLNWPSTRPHGSTSLSSEVVPPLGNTESSTLLTGHDHLEQLNEVRNGLRRSLEDVSHTFQSDSNNSPVFRSGSQGFLGYPTVQQNTEIESLRIPPLYPSQR